MVYKSAESKEMIRMSNEPTVLEDIAGQAMFVKDAMGWRETGKYPKAVLLHGPPGTGKSSAALVLTRELQGEWFDPVNYTITNASDDRGIDFIRNELKQWSGVRAVGGARRVIIADEADGLTPAAQDANPLHGSGDLSDGDCLGRVQACCGHRATRRGAAAFRAAVAD